MPRFFVHPNIASAKTIDTDFYTSPKVFEQCKEHIFASTWQYVGSAGLVKEPGDTYPLTLLENYLDEPLVLTMDKAKIFTCSPMPAPTGATWFVISRANTTTCDAATMAACSTSMAGFTPCPSLRRLKIFPATMITLLP